MDVHFSAELSPSDLAIARRPPSTDSLSSPKVRWRFSEGKLAVDDIDDVAQEEPLEIRWGQTPLAVLMRTPGSDEELAVGFCLTEGIIESPDDLSRVVHCSRGEDADKVILLTPSATCEVDPTKFTRSLYTSSSCGVCGKRSIERALRVAPPLPERTVFAGSILEQLPRSLRGLQPGFDKTGALHAAALCSAEGRVLCAREDIGRHNAVDKVVGFSAMNRISTSQTCLVVSGRCSFEIVQKALAARIELIVAVGGVSSLAVDLATRAGMTLLGFVRNGTCSIYSHPERVQ